MIKRLLQSDTPQSAVIRLARLVFFTLYTGIFRFTPEDYRPYALFFPQLRSWLVRCFIVRSGTGLRVKHNADISPNIRIGNNSELGTRCLIQSGVAIGDDVIMGPDVKIYARNHGFDRLDIPMRLQGETAKETVIGNDVWIGANVLIMPGVTVGNHTILAAGAIVTRDVPDYAMAGGNPARIIRMRNTQPYAQAV